MKSHISQTRLNKNIGGSGELPKTEAPLTFNPLPVAGDTSQTAYLLKLEDLVQMFIDWQRLDVVTFAQKYRFDFNLWGYIDLVKYAETIVRPKDGEK